MSPKKKQKPEVKVEESEHTNAVEQSTLDNALSLITREFGLEYKDYVVSAFTDKPDVVSVTVVNAEYELTVKIKMPVELGVR